MKTNFNFTQLDKHQLSSPGAHPSPTSLVMNHSKILLLDQVTVCYTLRLPLPCREGFSDSQLSASCAPATFTSKTAVGEKEPARETFCGVLRPDLEEHSRTSARLPVPGPSPHSLGYQFQEGLGRSRPVRPGRENGIGNHAGSLRCKPYIIRLLRPKKHIHIHFKCKAQYSKEILS